ncbi:phospholipid carrier-dependent glycosyltransferase [Okibacterium endophyticum]
MSDESRAPFAEVLATPDGSAFKTGDVTAGSPTAVERGSRLDVWFSRVMSHGVRLWLWRWGAPLAVVLLAGCLRFWNLGHPHALVFDETFYVKDAYTLLNNGYESGWPADPDDDFNAGRTDGFTDDPAYVVHPPLGKWLIAVGLAIFGAGDSFGWRVVTAALGTLAVAVIMVVAHRLFASRALVITAGLLFAIDGHAIVMSRVALLDGILMFFTLVGFLCVLLDRLWHEQRLSSAVSAARATGSDQAWGPALWWRPWLVAAGLAFGAATAVKWSGLYFLAAFGLYVVLSDALLRRRLGLPFWISAAILKQGPISFILLVPVALAAYLASWTGWFVTDGGYNRHWAEQPENALSGVLSVLPTTLQSFVHYHQSIYGFHVGLSQSHPYSANPLSWLLMARPTSMWYRQTGAGDDGCFAESCSSAITSVANPLIWWAGAVALFYLAYRLVRYREWRPGLVLMGIVAGYLPWLMYTGRTVYQFYTIAFEPYLILALVLTLGVILGRRDDERYRRTSGIALTVVFVTSAVLLSAFWYPLWTATTVPHWFWMLHNWLPGWI